VYVARAFVRALSRAPRSAAHPRPQRLFLKKGALYFASDRSEVTLAAEKMGRELAGAPQPQQPPTQPQQQS
jgi:hypothetical protein